ncbi:MAG: tRNA epoxyqueuosine(34) reductase QueG [Verrucomicrobia bacterium]|nr:tRNA epoxyqueuosine(34) reductase QueG [Verrucomicrobiota bacterium]
MKDAVRRKAIELGFSECRFAAAEVPRSGGAFSRWLEAGRHGEMAYLQRNAEKRLDPQRVLPGVRTFIVLAIAYTFRDAEQPPAQAVSEPRGQVARYAWHADYHEVLRQPLDDLARFIERQGGGETQCLAYVDTGPILERDAAQSAGIGFIGKHTNLIGRRLGNWFLLAEILTTALFEPDPPETNRCGSCTRCLAACPTGALVAPFEMDARRCISYLTIELKGSIPESLRRPIGGRVFGCDDCLEVCPWNRFAKEAGMMNAAARPDLRSVPLHEWLQLDDAGFKRRFAGTPMWRTKRRGLLRNVCVALGNVGNADSLAPLAKAVQDPEPLVQEHARWAIAEIESRRRAATAASE